MNNYAAMQATFETQKNIKAILYTTAICVVLALILFFLQWTLPQIPHLFQIQVQKLIQAIVKQAAEMFRPKFLGNLLQRRKPMFPPPTTAAANNTNITADENNNDEDAPAVNKSTKSTPKANPA